jgi:hypothetical protein
MVLFGIGTLSSQAVPRTDLPRSGALRVTFDPQISVWRNEWDAGLRRPLGWFLTSGLAGGDIIPQIARLESDIATATSSAGYLAILGKARLSLRAERRVTPLLLEWGVTDRLAVGLRVPLVRVQMRASFALDSTNGNLGRNPRAALIDGDSQYELFFGQFDAALTQMQGNIAAGTYGPPGSGTRAAAQAFADSAVLIRGALFRVAFGAGIGDAAPFLPTASSFAGVALGANVDRIQQRFNTGFGVGGFTLDYLLPTQRASATDVNATLLDEAAGWGATPILGTRRAQRFWLGDVEIQARYGLVRGPNYAATVGGVVRLPTGHQESPHNFIDLAAGDHQVDVEGELTQEVRLGRLWLNAAVRLGLQQPGGQLRRIGPADAHLLPRGATAHVNWNPGDYVLVDVAPMYRFTPQFGAGPIVSIYQQGTDRYTYRSTQDSLDVAAALGLPTSASVLEGGTAVRRVRLGWAVTFTGPVVEGSLSVDRVISARGTGVPATTLFRIVMRRSFQLF